jgi:cobalt-precorrin 5A hydrolase
VVGDETVNVRAVGFGASSAATVEDVLALVRATAMELHGAATITLATVTAREGLGRGVAAALGCRLAIFAPAELARVADEAALTRISARALAAIGAPSVAEAAALAALGPRARLIVTRRTGRGCTCALAELP